MEFRFNVNDLFRSPIVEIGASLIPPGVAYSDKRALWDAVTKVSEIVNAMGEASALAQGLTKPITTSDRLRNSEQKLYLLIDSNANKGQGAVTGMLKTGKKGLYVFDREGHHYQVQPSCVLDFYIHESKQRMGLGKKLFEHMLAEEKVEPVKLAIDRPSEKFLGFLNKHYSLNNPVRQMNNFVVFDGFFPEPVGGHAKGDSSDVPTTKSNQAANGLQSNFTTTYGRYGAPRPPCSMGQIIHNQSPLSHQAQEPTGTSLYIRPAPKIKSDQAPSIYHGHKSRNVSETKISENEQQQNNASNQQTTQDNTEKVATPIAQQQQQQTPPQTSYNNQVLNQQMQNYHMQHPHAQPQYSPAQVQYTLQQAPQQIQMVQQPTQITSGQNYYQQPARIPQEHLQSHAQQEQFRTTTSQQPQLTQQDLQSQQLQQQELLQQQLYQQQLQQQQLQYQQVQQQQLQQSQPQAQQEVQQRLQQEAQQQVQLQQQAQQQLQQQAQHMQEQQQLQRQMPQQQALQPEMKKVSGTLSESQVNYQQFAQQEQYIQPPYEGIVRQQQLMQPPQQLTQPQSIHQLKQQPMQHTPDTSQQFIQQAIPQYAQQLTYVPIKSNQEVNMPNVQSLHQIPVQSMGQISPTQPLIQAPIQMQTNQPFVQYLQPPMQQTYQQPMMQQLQPIQQPMQVPSQQMHVPQEQISTQQIQQPIQMQQPIQNQMIQPSVHQMPIQQMMTQQPSQLHVHQTQQVPMQQIQQVPMQQTQQVPMQQTQQVPMQQTQIPMQQAQVAMQQTQQAPQVYASQPNVRTEQRQVPVAEAQSVVNTTHRPMQTLNGVQQHRPQVPPQTQIRTQEVNVQDTVTNKFAGNVQISASYGKVGQMNNVPNAAGDMQPIEAR